MQGRITVRWRLTHRHLYVFRCNTGDITAVLLCYAPIRRNRKGNIGATFQVTQFASIRYLFPMLPVFPLLYRRSAYHVPSVPDVTCGAGGTCGTFAPSGKWYARVVLIRLAIAFVTFCESNKDTFDSGAIISLCALRGDEAMLPQIIFEKGSYKFYCLFLLKFYQLLSCKSERFSYGNCGNDVGYTRNISW